MKIKILLKPVTKKKLPIKFNCKLHLLRTVDVPVASPSQDPDY